MNNDEQAKLEKLRKRISPETHMKYNEADEALLKATVSTFNRKVRKLEKAGAVAPEKISLTVFRKENTETRQDFNRELHRLQRFQKENAAKPVVLKEHDVTITRWEAIEVTRQINIINRKREKLQEKMQKLEITDRGKPVLGEDGKPLKKAQMQGPQHNALNKKIVKLDRLKSLAEFRALEKSTKKEVKKEFFSKKNTQWQKNYLTALGKEYSKSEAKEIRNKIQKMSPDEFAKVMRREQQADIVFQYGIMEKQAKMQILKNIWNPEKSTEKLPEKSDKTADKKVSKNK